MKLAFNTFACPNWPLDRVLDAAVNHGYHGVELRCDARHGHGVEVWTSPDERRAFRKKLDAAGIELCCLATSLQFIRRDIGDHARKRIDFAHELGCPGIRAFCGSLAEGLSVTDAIRMVADHLHDVTTTAAEAGVDIWLETHDTFSRGADCVAAVRMVDHQSIGIVYDNLHPVRMGESVAETFAAIGPLIRYVHLHDGLNRPDVVFVTPLGKGEMPVTESFEALVTSGYNGYICGEWFHNQYGDDRAEALDLYREDIWSLCEPHGIRLR